MNTEGVDESLINVSSLEQLAEIAYHGQRSNCFNLTISSPRRTAENSGEGDLVSKRKKERDDDAILAKLEMPSFKRMRRSSSLPIAEEIDDDHKESVNDEKFEEEDGQSASETGTKCANRECNNFAGQVDRPKSIYCSKRCQSREQNLRQHRIRGTRVNKPRRRKIPTVSQSAPVSPGSSRLFGGDLSFHHLTKAVNVLTAEEHLREAHKAWPLHRPTSVQFDTIAGQSVRPDTLITALNRAQWSYPRRGPPYYQYSHTAPVSAGGSGFGTPLGPYSVFSSGEDLSQLDSAPFSVRVPLQKLGGPIDFAETGTIVNTKPVENQVSVEQTMSLSNVVHPQSPK